jgi:hypothetical protein
MPIIHSLQDPKLYLVGTRLKTVSNKQIYMFTFLLFIEGQVFD